MSEGRRRRTIRATDGFLTVLLDGEPKNYRVVEGAMPADAKIVDLKFDGFRNEVVFLVESAEFEPVEDGKPYPECSITIKQTFARLDVKPSGN